MSPAPKRVVIGWREWVELPEWGLRLKAKIDTGAQSSSIDVADIEHLPDNRVRFTVRTRLKSSSPIPITCPVLKETRVRSSNGEVQERIVVKTWLRMGGVEKAILITLSNRRKMKHRMLLGREALLDDFLVDAGEDYLIGS